MNKGSAIVLGGGGIAGIAWEASLIAGLSEAGIDLASADLVVGTSAGSVVGTALRNGDISTWFGSQLGPESGSDLEPVIDLEPFTTAIAQANVSTSGEEETRARLGALSLSYTDDEREAASVARIRPLLPSADWPDGNLRITAVDIVDGSFVVFDSNSGVELARAVAASCAVPGVYPAVTINGRQYMDGGMRSATNADVATGFDRVLVLACSAEAPSSPLGQTLPQAAALLRETGDVLVVEADADSLMAFGANSLLLSSRAASSAAGARQAQIVADEVRAFWG